VHAASAAELGIVESSIAKNYPHQFFGIGGILAQFADAVVVGSAIMRIVAAHRGLASVVGEVGSFIRRLRDGIQTDRAHV
jgi:hypothetical protein